MNKVLVANRGEIALRIIRACHEEGLEAVAVYSDADRSSPHVRAADRAEHIGPSAAAESYLDIRKLLDAAARILALAQRLEDAGIRLAHIDLGGGFGIRYRDESPASVGEFVDGALGVLAGRGETLILDPGRAIVGNAGLLLTRVLYAKRGAEKNFLVVDAAMNDLIRPALYGAWHDVRPVRISRL